MSNNKPVSESEEVDKTAAGVKNIELAESNEEIESSTPDDDYFIDEVALKDAEIDLTPEELKERKELALKFKEEGNNLFKDGNFTQACVKYTAGLRICPLENVKERAILYANRAASSMKEGRRKEAIEDCTFACELDPTYLKALKRRAALYEEDEKYDESLGDYKKILEIDKCDREAFEAVQRLPEKINERNEKLKTEMLGTLKNLGNKILRPFGLSTENFQLQQDPNSGGYTINFNQNKS